MVARPVRVTASYWWTREDHSYHPDLPAMRAHLESAHVLVELEVELDMLIEDIEAGEL